MNGGNDSHGSWDATLGGIVTSQVIMDDGSESSLTDHLRDDHRKGTRGYTDEYLADMHRSLHERKLEDDEPEHTHPGPDPYDPDPDPDGPEGTDWDDGDDDDSMMATAS